MPTYARSGIASPVGRVTLAGRLTESRGLPERPMRVLGSYAAVYVVAGGGRFLDGQGHRAEVGAGDLLLLHPEIPHTYGPRPGGRWSEIFLVFDGPVFDLWRAHRLLDPARPVVRLEPPQRWAGEFARLLDDVQQSRPRSGLRVVCRVQEVLAAALTGPRGSGADTDQRWLAGAMALLDADVRQETPLQRLSAELAMSYDGFRKRFRRLAGVSPGRYRAMRVVDRACELMAETTLTDRQIAAELGFCDQFHFSHRFRAITGQSPRQFRATLPER